MIAQMEARLRRRLGGDFRHFPRWRDHRQMFDRAYLIVQVYYIATAMFLYSAARGVSHSSADTTSLDLLWPVAWMALLPSGVSTEILANAYVIAGFLGIFFWRFLAVRVFVLLVVLQFTAWPNSFGGINHAYHEWFWLSVCFLFLPAGSQQNLRESRADRTRFLYAFAIAPALILFFYSLSGAYKLYYASVSLVSGHYGGFMPDAMAQTLARRALETGSEPLWSDVIINYPVLGWPLYLSLYFVEIFAIVVVFRPVLYKLWGFLLIAFHFGTLTFMDITFPQHIFINGLLFVMSPFVPRTADWRTTLIAVPLFGRWLSMWLARRNRPTMHPAQ